jgi:SAM-dependent methyltransferase
MDSWDAFLRSRGAGLSILEISPGWNQHWKKVPGSSYRSVDYPEFDISREALPERFDVVIADQVLEHVLDVDSAVANIHEMVAPGGHALIATPFLFRVHGRPNDFRRWTEAGLRHLLVSNGFADEDLQTFSWGNKGSLERP